MSSESAKQGWTCPMCGSACRGERPKPQAVAYDDPYAEEREDLADSRIEVNDGRVSVQ